MLDILVDIIVLFQKLLLQIIEFINGDVSWTKFANFDSSKTFSLR